MFFRSFFDEKLAQYSYLIACQRTGEALVIDPARDIEPYISTAKKEGFTITAAAETHIHADFVSGARELCIKHDVKLYVSAEGGEDWSYTYLGDVSHQLLHDGDTFKIGNIAFKVMHTPGHTPESLSYILTDKGGNSEVPMGIFTGDYVFVGDVGRPDLLEKAAHVAGSSEKGAKDMYESLKRFKELPDYLLVWPGHGAGSACGKSLGAVPMTTVGYEKINNWALKETDEATFIKILLADQPEPPTYFAEMKKVNKKGPALRQLHALEQLDHLKSDAVWLDTRSPDVFNKQHVVGSLNIPFNKAFPNWSGWLLDYNKDIILITEPEQVSNVRHALQSIGLDQVIGWLSPNQALANARETATYDQISPEELKTKKKYDDLYILDVRNQNEWQSGHMDEAHHVMLGHLEKQLDELPKDKTIVVHCQSGARSAIAVSLLQSHGFNNVVNLTGGYGAYEKIK